MCRHSPQNVEMALLSTHLSAVLYPIAPHTKNPTLPTRFQNPTASNIHQPKVGPRTGPCLPCQPRSVRFGSHHFFCTSMIRTSDDATNPVPPITTRRFPQLTSICMLRHAHLVESRRTRQLSQRKANLGSLGSLPVTQCCPCPKRQSATTLSERYKLT